jgi:hypothetical protein
MGAYADVPLATHMSHLSMPRRFSKAGARHLRCMSDRYKSKTDGRQPDGLCPPVSSRLETSEARLIQTAIGPSGLTP